jgi:hypothetical protein
VLGEGRTARCWLAAPDSGTTATTRTVANGPTMGSSVT